MSEQSEREAYYEERRQEDAYAEGSLPTVYVFCNQKNCDGRGDWHSMIAVDEDGNGLAGHICSSHGWARHDMGVDQDGWKRDLYAKRYPNGFTVRWVEGAELEALVAKWTASRPVPSEQGQ